MIKSFLFLFILFSNTCFSQTVRDTIRIPGTDSTTIVITTKITTQQTGTTTYTYPVTTTAVTYYKVANNVTPPPPNQLPIVNAGTAQTITLPLNTVNLSGSASDPDGTVIAYLWEKTSGGNAVIGSPNAATTSVTNMAQGGYTFRLTATDNSGGKVSATVSITVNPEITPPPSGNTGIASAVPTFENCGFYWSGHGQSSSMVCNIQYRVAGETVWNDGYPLVFDSRAHNANDVPNYTNGVVRPPNEYRGSITGLKSETTYEYRLTAGTVSYSGTFTTWTETEHLPIGSITTLNSSTTITTSGTPTAWRVYEGNIGNGTNNLIIDASYIIIRNMSLKAAGEDAILLKANAHDIRIIGNTITGWGFIGMGSNNQAAVRVKGLSGAGSTGTMKNVSRIVIERNTIFNSRENQNNGWDNGGTHPTGPNGINFEEGGENNVIRYNDIYNTGNQCYMDGIGGADNFTKGGFPRANSDIYGNKIAKVFDDAIEAEGASVNVRIYGNYIDTSFVGIGIATTSIGPIYVYRNVFNHARRLNSWACSSLDNEDRGGFIKAGTQVAITRGGAAFIFHNTLLQPDGGCTYPLGAGYGIQDAGGGAFNNLTSRNNILYIWRSNRSDIGLFNGSGTGNNFNYDLYNGTLDNIGSGQESNGIKGTPIFTTQYFLSQTSPGVDRGTVLKNFNDGFKGSAPDIGAWEIGTPPLQYGVKAYLQ